MQFVLVLFEILTILSIIYLIAMENIFMCAMISGLFSVCITAIYCILNAPDIAITESAINIVVGPTIFILSILHLKDIYNNKNFSKIPQDITKKIFFIGLLFITIFFILNNTLSEFFHIINNLFVII